MATIGEMAAGIAHEVSNPLSSVIGYSDWLLKQDIPGEIKEDLKVINNGAIRAGDILRRLLSFAGQRSTERDYMDINQIVEVAVSLLHHSLSNSNIEVIKQYDDSLPKIKVHEGQLQDVFINLIMNAEYSMLKAHNGGKLRIRTEKTDSSVRISFQDDGSGISKEDIGSLFKPFFTTKPIGKGTGLGLSVCYGTITAHGGDIYVESEPGKGATFCIELPFPS
jgi:signal transduction histidine kinase